MYNPKECPAYNHGRWYEFFIESDGSNYTMTTADLDGVTFSGNYLKMPDNFHVVQTLLDINPYHVEAATSIDLSLRQYADGTQGITLPVRNNMDWCRVYVFGYFS